MRSNDIKALFGIVGWLAFFGLLFLDSETSIQCPANQTSPRSGSQARYSHESELLWFKACDNNCPELFKQCSGKNLIINFQPECNYNENRFFGGSKGCVFCFDTSKIKCLEGKL